MVRDKNPASNRRRSSAHKPGEWLAAKPHIGRFELNSVKYTQVDNRQITEADSGPYGNKLTDDVGQQTGGADNVLKDKGVDGIKKFEKDAKDNSVVRDKEQGEAMRDQKLANNNNVRQHDNQQDQQKGESSIILEEKFDRPNNKHVGESNARLQRPRGDRPLRVLDKSIYKQTRGRLQKQPRGRLAELQSRFHQHGITNSLELSEDELQTLLKSELQAAKTAAAETFLDTEVTSRFTSVGKTILIIGYHRTGSTLLGTLFQRNAGTFYLFEPLHVLEVSTEFWLLNGTIM